MVKIGFFNRTARRAASSALIGMLFLTNTSLPALAQEAVPELETQEYVVLAKNAKAAAEIEDGYSDDMLDGGRNRHYGRRIDILAGTDGSGSRGDSEQRGRF